MEEKSTDDNSNKNSMAAEDDLLKDFMNEIENSKPVTKKSILKAKKEELNKRRQLRHKTGREMVEYLTRHGSKYGNLNPFDVLDLDFDCSITEVKKRSQQAMRFVHPDRNQDVSAQAHIAFDRVLKSKKILTEEETRDLCAKVVEQAKEFVTSAMETRRMALIKQKKPSKLLEDDPVQYYETVRMRVSVIFADMEFLKEEKSKREARDREREIELEKVKKELEEEEREAKKLHESSRTDRVHNWKSFVKREPNALRKAKHYVEKNSNVPLPQKMIDSVKYIKKS